MARPFVIDLGKDLPHRATPLAADAMSQVFGGCKQDWDWCNFDSDCCHNRCQYHAWIADIHAYVYECLPTWAAPNY